MDSCSTQPWRNRRRSRRSHTHWFELKGKLCSCVGAAPHLVDFRGSFPNHRYITTKSKNTNKKKWGSTLDVFPLDIFDFQKKKKIKWRYLDQSAKQSNWLSFQLNRLALDSTSNLGQYCLLRFSDKCKKPSASRKPDSCKHQDFSMMPTCEKTVIQHHLWSATKVDPQRHPCRWS